MHVFVWKSYGEIDVWSMVDMENRNRLKTELVSALQSEGDTDVNDSMPLPDILEVVCTNTGYSDMFETGTGIYKVKG